MYHKKYKSYLRYYYYTVPLQTIKTQKQQMKKTTLLIGLILITTSVFGQERIIEFGLKAGLNYSNFLDTNEEDIPAEYNGKIGFHIGGFVVFGITEKISIRPEILYSQQGSDFSINASDLNIFDPGDDFFASIAGEIKESLILLPIMFEYRVSESFDLELGPQLAYLIKRDLTYDNNQNLFPIRNDDSEKFEIGINLGLGYSFAEKYRIGLRYNYGIIERQNLHSSVIQLGMNYKL